MGQLSALTYLEISGNFLSGCVLFLRRSLVETNIKFYSRYIRDYTNDVCALDCTHRIGALQQQSAGV